MTTQKYFYPLSILGLLLIGILVGWSLSLSQSQRIGHIQTATVFASFELKQELEATLKNRQQSRQTLLENLELQFRQMETRKISQDSLAQFWLTYQEKKEAFAQDELADSEAYTQQIWTQLNQYLRDYCEENELEYLLGANGDGSILGASTEKDYTDEVIAFVNRKYRDG